MVSEQVGYEGSGQRRGEEVALDHTEVHDNEEKSKIQASTRATILRKTGKKIIHNTDQNPKYRYTDTIGTAVSGPFVL